METLTDETQELLKRRQREAEQAQRYAEQARQTAQQAQAALNAAVEAVILENGMDPESASVDLRAGVVKEEGD